MSGALNYGRRGTVLFGLAVAGLFFVAGGGWAALAPISSAAIATGTVSPEGARVPVQHLEGGIVEAIRVANGDRVAAGDPLIVLRPVDAATEVETLRIRQRRLAAEAERLRAERDGLAAPAFAHESLAERSDPKVAALLVAERQRFAARIEATATEVDLRRRQIAQTQERIAGNRAQIERIDEQLALIEQEIAGVAKLYEKQLVPLQRFLGLKRQRSELRGEAERLTAAIAGAETEVTELELEIAAIERRRAEEIEERLAETEARLAETTVALSSGLDKLQRTVLRAPVAGTVLNLAANAEGAVIEPGADVLELVPAERALIVDLRLAPGDIDTVAVGQPAVVTFPGLSSRNLKRLEGTLTWVSADAVQDERSGASHYEARVELTPEALASLPADVALKPGMPAEAFVQTGSRTFLDYATAPLVDSFGRALREE